MSLELLLALAAALVAALAVVRASLLAKKLERLTESYWELRYETGQLRDRLTLLEGTGGSDVPAAAPSTGKGSFIPLSTLKR